jgi:hypothetical protein
MRRPWPREPYGLEVISLLEHPVLCTFLHTCHENE